MISKISKKIAEALVQKNEISEDETELFHYGLFVIISELFVLIYCLIVGVVFKIVFASVLFYVIFGILHRFAGGFHMKTELCCQIITSILFLTGIVGIKYSLFIEPSSLVIVYALFSILLVIFSPVDTPQKPLDHQEYIMFKNFIIMIVLICSVIVIILNLIELYIYANTIIVAVVIQTISVIFGKLFNKNL